VANNEEKTEQPHRPPLFFFGFTNLVQLVLSSFRFSSLSLSLLLFFFFNCDPNSVLRVLFQLFLKLGFLGADH
jgi:hypothetical protein